MPATDAISCSIPVEAAAEEELERVGEVVRDHAGILATTLRKEGIR